MSEEEKKAIQNCKKRVLKSIQIVEGKQYIGAKNLEIVLNLITKQQKEINLNKKIINLMADDLVNYYGEIERKYADTLSYSVPKTIEEVIEFYRKDVEYD